MTREQLPQYNRTITRGPYAGKQIQVDERQRSWGVWFFSPSSPISITYVAFVPGERVNAQGCTPEEAIRALERKVYNSD